MVNSMPGVQVELMTPALAPAAMAGACTPSGMAAVLLPGINGPIAARLREITDASKPLPRGTHVLIGRQDTPQQPNLWKFAYKNRIAATSGAAAGPHPAWDPV